MTKTIIILHYDVTTVHGIVGFTARFARDAEDAELDKILFSISSSATKALSHKGYTLVERFSLGLNFIFFFLCLRVLVAELFPLLENQTNKINLCVLCASVVNSSSP